MINPTRHLSVFSPTKFGDLRVNLIGVGATGSRIGLELSKLGVQNLRVFDDDIVESHNIANQIFGEDQIGKLKCDALAELIKRNTNSKIVTELKKADGSENLGDIVYLLTDTMSSRKEIWEKGIKLNPNVKLMVETRMGVDECIVWTINPCNMTHIKKWEGSLFDDSKGEQPICSARTTVGATASLVSSLATWQLIHWFNKYTGGSDDLNNFIAVSLRPITIVGRQF